MYDRVKAFLSGHSLKHTCASGGLGSPGIKRWVGNTAAVPAQGPPCQSVKQNSNGKDPCEDTTSAKRHQGLLLD